LAGVIDFEVLEFLVSEKFRFNSSDSCHVFSLPTLPTAAPPEREQKPVP
jgi:hypothetical protein